MGAIATGAWLACSSTRGEFAGDAFGVVFARRPGVRNAGIFRGSGSSGSAAGATAGFAFATGGLLTFGEAFAAGTAVGAAETFAAGAAVGAALAAGAADGADGADGAADAGTGESTAFGSSRTPSLE